MGRRAKGDRELLGTRAPLPLAEAARERAGELGMTVSDYLATLIAQDTGLTRFAPATHTSNPTQLELPIPTA